MRYRAIGDVDPTETQFVREFLDERGWQPTDGDDWDLLWSYGVPDYRFYRQLAPSQRLNHFPGAYTLHYKDELAHFLDAGGAADLHPRTFSMPRQYAAWLEVARSEPETIWVRKHKRLSGAIGAMVFSDPAAFEPDSRWILQEYVADPLLLPGYPYKHVIRLYAAITSLDPLEAHLYRNGPVKFTSRPFTADPDAFADRIVHFTNPYVQRHNDEVEDAVRSIDMPQYRERLRQAGHDDEELWRRLTDAVRRTLEAHREPMLRVSGYVCDRLECCFELVGFDFIVDAQLRPWVLECNVSPALGVRGADGSAHHAAQRRAKQPMVGDLLGLVLDGEPGGFVAL